MAAPSFKAPSQSVRVPSAKSPKTASGFRYRRSTVTKAPRKRTFIYNMTKFIIEAETPSGLQGGSAASQSACFGPASAPCRVAPCKAAPQKTGAGPCMAAIPSNGDHGGSGGASVPHPKKGGDDDGASNGCSPGNGDGASLLILAAVIALGVAMFPITPEAFADSYPFAAPAGCETAAGSAALLATAVTVVVAASLPSVSAPLREAAPKAFLMDSFVRSAGAGASMVGAVGRELDEARM